MIMYIYSLQNKEGKHSILILAAIYLASVTFLFQDAYLIVKGRGKADRVLLQLEIKS